MKASHRYLAAFIVGGVLAAGAVIAPQLAKADKAKVPGMGPAKEVGEEVVAMCNYCNTIDAGSYCLYVGYQAPDGGDRLGGGCSYPPCTLPPTKPPPRPRESYGLQEEKLICTGCRALCPP